MIIGTNFKLSSKKYLDNRQQCASLNDLITNKDSILYPQGFEVYCIKEKAWYQNVSEGDTPEWKIRQSGTSEGGASIDDTKISATTTWSSEYIYDMKLELQDLITQTEDYVAEIDDRLLYVEGRLTSIGSFDGSYDSLTNKPEFPSLQGYATHEYVDEVIANIGKIEGTKDYNELINQPINNVAIEYIIDGRLIVNVDYLKAGKWYIVNTDLNEEYNSATSFSLVYYLSSDSYSIINTFENEDMHSLIYVSSEDEKEIKIKYITVNGKTYELIYNKETNEKILNLLSSSGGNGNGGFSGDYNDLENRPCYGDAPVVEVIEKTITDFSYENRDVVEIGALYAGWNNDLETRVFVNICQDFNEDDMKGLLNNGVFIDNTYFGELYECSFVIDSEGYGNVQLYDKGCYFYTPYSSTIDFILVTEDNYIFGDGTPLSRGIWLNYVYCGGLDYIDEFVMPDGAYITFKYTTKSVNNDSFKQLDEKYIPDSIKDYNNLSNVPCIDSRKIELEKFDIESICNKGIGDSIAEEFAIYDKIEIADGISIFKINDEPLFTYDDFLYCYLHRIDFDDNYIIIGRSINSITEKYDLDYMSSYYINNECYDPNKFLFIQDGLLIVFEDDTSILLETGNTITLSKGSYGVMEENSNTSHGKCTSAWCEIEFCHYVGEFKELDEKFIRSHLDGIYDSMVGAYRRRNNETFGEIFNSYEESYNRADGKYSHAEGFNTKASSFAQHVQGKYNIEDTEDKYSHIVGNGVSSSKRSNAHTLDWDGNAWFQGNVSVDGTPTNDNDLVTKKYVDHDLVINSLNNYEWFRISKDNADLISTGSASFTVPDNLDFSTRLYDDEKLMAEFKGKQGNFVANNYSMTQGKMLQCLLPIDNSICLDIVMQNSHPSDGIEDGAFDDFTIDVTFMNPNTFETIIPPQGVLTEDIVLVKSYQYLNENFTRNNITFANSLANMDSEASGINSIAVGGSCNATGNMSAAFGKDSDASGFVSFAAGTGSATGDYSHSANSGHASGKYSHAENNGNASGKYSHAENNGNAHGLYSHAEGYATIANGENQHVQGRLNIADNENKYAHIVGNGTEGAGWSDPDKRSNAHTLDWNGNAWFQGNVSVDGTPTNDKDLTTKKYVDDLVSNVDIDLSDYITNTELEGKGYITEIPSEYITDTELEEEMIFETDSLTVNSLGGISANTDLNGLTVKEILNKLLFPYIEPVITVTATPNGGTYEKGNNQTITNVSVSITKKSEKITKIEVLNGTQVLARQQDEAINNGGTFNYNVNVNVPSTNKQLTVKVTDNSGNAITKTTNSFTFVYPYYYGVCDEGTTINGDLIKSLTKSVTSKGTKTVTYTTNNQRMIFAYPKSYGVITKILDPNSFDVTSTFTMSQITIIGLDGTGQSYYVYVNSPSTVSNFNMKFSY